MTTIIKKDGTRKAVKVNGFVSEKSIAVYDRQTKSYTEKERPAVKLMSAAYVNNVQTFKVRVSNIYVWLQKGTKAKGLIIPIPTAQAVPFRVQLLQDLPWEMILLMP